MVERARLVSLRRLGAALVSRNALQAALTGVATLLAGPALALDYCDAQQPCLQSGVTCYYSVCVPDSAICTADSQCDGWETCDMTCQGLPGGTSSGGGSTEPIPIPGEDAGSSGGGSGEMPMPKVDAGSGFAPPPDSSDTNTAIPQPDWDGSGTDGGWTAPSCPTDKGICKAKAEKIPIQEVCIDFCAVMLKCDGMGGGGSSDPGEPTDPPPMPGVDAGSSGGSGGSGGAPTPPDFDAGSSDKKPAPPMDAGQASDAGAFDPMPDGDGIMEPPAPDETMQCQTICSLVVLEKIAAPQFQGLTKCIADSAKETCESIESHCGDEQEAFEDAMTDKDEFVLALLGMSLGGGGKDPGDPGTDVSTGEDTAIFVDGGSTGGTDQTGSDGAIAADGNESQNDSSGRPQEPDSAAPLGDTVGADGVANADASTTPTGTYSKKSDSGGCTAGATSSQSSTGLAGLLGLFATALVSRRRLQRVAVKSQAHIG